MKTSILATAISLLLSGSAFATIVNADTVAANSAVIVGVQSSASSSGNGYAFQGVQASGWNQSGAAIQNNTSYDFVGPTVGAQTTLGSSAYSNGGTATSSQGVQYGNASNQGTAVAGQSGSADAATSGGNPYGFAAVNSSADNTSGSLSANFNNGFTANSTEQYAGNVSQASVGGTTTFAGPWYHPVVVGQTTNASGSSIGGTSSESHNIGIWALSGTGGSVSQSGGAIAIAP